MSFGSTITITVDSVAKVLNRVSDSEAYASNYFLEDGTREYRLSIKHTVPKTRGASKESHLMRLDIDDYDTDNVLVCSHSYWMVMQTTVGRQDTASAALLAPAFTTLVTASADDLLDRLS